MGDFINNEEKQVSGTQVQPQKYNIVLTRDGEEVEFDFPPATVEMITRFGYVIPEDQRCSSGLINEEEDIYEYLSAVLGQTYKGELAFHTRKQVLISLHDTAILGYQRQTVIDPRISNEVGTFWEIYLDERIFPQSEEEDWRTLMAEVIITELTDDEADRRLAEDIKDRLLEQAR